MNSHFGTTKTGQDVTKITLRNDHLTVSILTWGAVLQDVRLAGVDYPLTQGSEVLADYEDVMRYHGSLIGPVANRISNARIKIDGMMHELERNLDGRIFLHSGSKATHLQVWDIQDQTNTSVTLAIALPDGMCGLPGNRQIMAVFAIDGPVLTLRVTGTTDATTPLNFANHSYWNFDNTPVWDGHVLQIAADHYLPSTADFYPTGDIVDVTGTEMDFRMPRTITHQGNPFDNNFCLSDGFVPLRDVLTLTGASGVGMRVATDQPGVQVYDGRHAIRPGKAPFEGLAIEAQGWPDAPNNRDFPSILVGAGDSYIQHTTFTFFR